MISRPVLWSGIEAAGSALFSVIGSFAIARLIGAEALGIGAAAVAVHVLLWVAVNALFADALVQRATLTDRAASSAFWASAAVGTLAMPIQIGAGYLLAALYDDQRLIPMAYLLAAPLPLVGAGGAMQGMLTRSRGYRALAIRTIVGQGSGAILGIVVALHDGGSWAPVLQIAASSLVGALSLLASGGWRPRPHWDRAAVAALLRIGLPLTASTLVQLGRYRLFAILIGGTAGPAALGQVHMAFRLVDTVRDLSFTALWRLMLPILSREQEDRARRLAVVDDLLRRTSRVVLPLCAILALSLETTVSVILGPGWAPAGQAAVPLVGLMALLVLMFPSGVALVAIGQARHTLYANLAGLVATLGLVLLLTPRDPWQAVSIWCAAQMFVSPYALWINGRALGVGPLRPLQAGAAVLVPIAIGTGVAALGQALSG